MKVLFSSILGGVSLLLVLSPSRLAAAEKSSPKLPIKMPRSSDIQTVTLGDNKVANISVNAGGCVITFPAKPSKVVLGREGQFDAQYIERDVALLPLTPASSTNLFVYVGTRRYAFSLHTSPDGGSRIIVVKNPTDALVEVDVR